MSRGADTRGRIKQEAMRLFVERGVDAVSVRDIADAVGMKPSNLYAHFHSREDLVRELFAEGYAEYGRQLRDVRGRGFAERLAAMIHLICRLHDEDTTRFRFLLLSQHAALAGSGAEDSPIDVVQDAVRHAMETNELLPGDPAVLTAMVVGIVLQAATFRMYGRLTTDLTRLAPQLADACLRLAEPGPSASPLRPRLVRRARLVGRESSCIGGR